ncbi:sperm flagellar protein 1-like [Cotesia glomerata]|uniref:sperm flagellar protein 1-like n=1 Tax=Cotesia glomerata TaxID=32391 RepID=UPI001D02E5AB|nr:sperm flagellar protein 1-like [Cotesia glomerata]
MSWCINTDELSDESFYGINIWLDQITFSRPRKNIARDFSNAVFMAELLKKYYPRYVDLHNYYHGNSLAKKLDNWRTLNKKVLSRISLKLDDKQINELATCKDKAIENLLLKVKNKICYDCNDERASLYSVDEQDIDRVHTIFNLDTQSKVKPKKVIFKLKRELEEKNELVDKLNEKIRQLEYLLQLKEQKIKDLSAQLVRFKFVTMNKTR